MIISKKKHKKLMDKAYSDGFADGANNTDADVISSIKWVEDDIRLAYFNHYKENATDREIKEIIDRCDWAGLESASIECAEFLDGDIMYYIPNDVLLDPESSDNDILEYIIKNVDSDVLDIFNKTKG